MKSTASRCNKSSALVKRFIDLILAIPLLILLAPFSALVGLVIKLDSSGPIFFKQPRLGFRGKVFMIYKFRTMLHQPELSSDSFLHKNNPRITRSGSLLRKYRLDELPQLLNVVNGEMSLVGPRPLLPEFLDSYSEEDRRRMNVPPGITGWQQVHGAAKNTWEQRVSLDLWYVDHWTVLVDFYIICSTVMVVLKADTVYDNDGFQRSGVPSHSSTSKS